MGVIELFLTGVGLSMDAFAVSVCKGLGMKRVHWGQVVIIALFFGGFQALMPLIGWAVGSLFSSYITAVDHWIAFGLLAFIGGKMLWDAFHEGEGECVCGRDCAACPRFGTPDCDDPTAAEADAALRFAQTASAAEAAPTAQPAQAADAAARSVTAAGAVPTTQPARTVDGAARPASTGPAPSVQHASVAGSASSATVKPLDYRELVMLAVATSIDALAVGITFAFLGVNIWIAIAVIGLTTFVLSFIGVAIGNQFGSRFERPATIAGGIVLILLGFKILFEHLLG